MFVPLLCLISCSSEDYYVNNGTVENITNKTWGTSYIGSMDGKQTAVYEEYMFVKNGMGYQIVQTYQNKEEIQEKKAYFHWTFMYPDCKVIYIDWGLYWKIKSLTATEFKIEETYDDPYQTPSQSYKRNVDMTLKKVSDSYFEQP